MNRKIGIACITAGIRTIPEQLYKYTSPNTLIHIEVDTEKNGPAITRNKALKYLYDEGCDYIVSIDDDTYPIKANWEEYLIGEIERTGVQFFGLPYLFESKFDFNNDNMLVQFDLILGCFQVQTRRVLEEIGYYNTKYLRYGYEDVSRNDRLKRGKMTYQGSTPSFETPLYLGNFFYSEDIYHTVQVQNMDQETKNSYIEQNRQVWLEEVNSPQLYYPYSDARN